MCIVGFDGRIRAANPAWEQVLKRPPAEIVGGHWLDLLHPEDRERAVRGAEQARSGVADTGGEASTHRFENRYQHRDGHYCWISWEVVPSYAEELFYAVGRDITNRKQQALELAATNQRLREQIAEREQAEDALRKMQRLEAVGQITAGVAHDFNNLLTVILGNVALLKPLTTDEKGQRRLETIRTAAQGGARLVSQLLAFSRQQRLEPRATDIHAVISGMRALLRSTVSSLVEVRTALDEAGCVALVDPTQLELVLLNLANNARDAMPAGGMLTIRTRQCVLAGNGATGLGLAPGAYVELSVADTGTGMSDEVKQRIFEPFFTTKDVGRGSGLGLAQVHGFAHQSGGTVIVDSTPGTGTTVTLWLPCAPLATEHPDRRDPALPAHDDGIVVLVVDDEPAVRDVLAQMLKSLGYLVLTAGSGAEALALVDQTPAVDLVLADIAMPGMTGIALADELHRRRPRLPVRYVTGYARPGLLDGLPPEAVVQKPVTPERLARLVRTALERGLP